MKIRHVNSSLIVNAFSNLLEAIKQILEFLII